MNKNTLKTQERGGPHPLAIKIYEIPTFPTVRPDEGFSDLLIFARRLSEHVTGLDLQDVRLRHRITDPCTLQIEFDLCDENVGQATLTFLAPSPIVQVSATGLLSPIELALCRSCPLNDHERAIEWVAQIAVSLSSLSNIWAFEEISTAIHYR